MTLQKLPIGAFLRCCSNVRWKPYGQNFDTAINNQLNTHRYYNTSSSSNKENRYLVYSAAAIGISTLFYVQFKDKFSSLKSVFKLRDQVYCEAPKDRKDEKVEPGAFKKGLPVYKISDVAEHKTKDTRIWVVYKRGVYDVTQFVDEHPGGNKILLAAGSSIEPFWALYAAHHTPEVYELLEAYRIGNLDESEPVEEPVSASDPYANDPKRHPALKPASVKPFNAEPPRSLLTDNFYTPNQLFYVRNHLPVPIIDPKEYRLVINGLGVDERTFTLGELKKFPKHTVTATVQCAGNRRSEMALVKPVKGLTWDQSAIGNAQWSGARLTDVLKACNFREHPDVEHVQFEGMDKGPDDAVYGASVPAEKVLNPKEGVILAYEMNGEELPRDHGYPIRVIVPGVVGARNVKWLTKITLSEEESHSHWQRNDYKGFSPSTDWDTVDFKTAPAIQELPVNSAICIPSNGDEVEVNSGSILVKGYAYSGGGRPIVRVDVSTNKGKTWMNADLVQEPSKNQRGWAWTLWNVLIPVDCSSEDAEIWVKAVDSSYNTQPELFDHIWNLRGVLGNGYHKITVKLIHCD